MLDDLNIENVLFLDIETVPQYPDYNDLPEDTRKFWNHKADSLKNIRNEKAEDPEVLYGKAGIYAEFGKIICISVGFIRKEQLRIKSFAGDDERELLSNFSLLLQKSFNSSDHLLCAHNGKEFDFPYISRRMLINGVRIPSLLDISGKKPWEVKHLDTMELWKFGDYKNYTSLALLTSIFNIPTPKDDIDGSQVGGVYWNEKNLQRIVEYCQKDVVAIVQLLRRYKGMELIDPSNIKIA
ncbi:MAG TPA: 3'-5' exonuclease [Lentimicrobium sp.]|nr:3'-5' exonuclease [Lentimicrobium sp.]